ncbi:hypothetical protein Pcinc_040099 [Petrolisthes cinctipes]|uniref:Uncharacterized protein n=1 Tax=Petrolisthes cinctipes TaxID=88211 RepID=A0AAE1BQX4_PETCI|nr:hypothetical protein Pcinc_040099 [Petrolisthes cinctipes]
METNQYLLFVDIKKGDLHRHYPANSKHQSLHVGKSTREALQETVYPSHYPVEGEPSYLVVGLGRSFALVEWPLDALTPSSL